MELERYEKLKSLVDSTSILGLGLIVAVIALAIGIHVLRSWYRDRDDPADSSDEILDQMRELHLEGDLSEEEFRSIKSRLRSRSET